MNPRDADVPEGRRDPADVVDSLSRYDPEDEVDEEGEGDDGDATGVVATSLDDVRFVGPATAEVLRESNLTAADILEKRVSYGDLTEAGVNPGVAARLRREHSLSWSFDSSGPDLNRRSAQVRGLDDEERAWVAASSGDWRATTNGRGADGDVDEEAAWRRRSAPTPVRTVDGVDADTAERLAEAGVTSVRRLATADPRSVADALSIDPDRVRRFCEAAHEHDD